MITGTFGPSPFANIVLCHGWAGWLFAVLAFLGAVFVLSNVLELAYWAGRKVIPAHWLRWMPTAKKDEYFALSNYAGKCLRRLGRETDLVARAELLHELAVAEQSMADLHMEAFGPDPIEWEGGRDLSESLRLSAGLLWLAACSADVLAGLCDEGTPADDPDGFIAAHADIASQLGVEHDPEARAALFDQLWDAVVDRVGGQAAESLASLARVERRLAARTAKAGA